MLERYLPCYLTFVFVVLVSVNTALARSCSISPTLLESYDKADLVVSVRADSINPNVQIKTREDSPLLGTVNMVVERVFKGSVSTETIVVQNGDSTMCGRYYNVGEKYLLYLSPESRVERSLIQSVSPQDIVYEIGFCDRSSLQKRLFGDVAYLSDVEKFRGRTRFSGQIVSTADFTKHPAELRYPPVSGIPITISNGSVTLRTTSNEDGFYEFYDIPPGKYSFATQMKKGWAVSGSDTFTVKEHQHTELEVYLAPDTTLAGRVVSNTGKAISEIEVTALPISAKGDLSESHDYVQTEKDGTYEFKNLVPGRYRMIVNRQNVGHYTNPKFGQAYFPGVENEGDASIVTVELGKVLQNINIRMPRAIEFVKISGTLKYSDGFPVVDEFVFFSVDTSLDFKIFNGKTDDKGRFILDVPKRAVGSIDSVIFADTEQELRCPGVKGLIDGQQGLLRRLRSNKINVNAASPVSGIKLIFPFAKCPSSKAAS